MTSAPSDERLTASRFYDPVVYLIGKLTGWRPYVGVHHELIRDDVLRLAGIELNDTLQGRDVSSKRRTGLYRKVHFAWRNQRYGYCGSRPALCAQPLPADGTKGQWALTREGVRQAKLLQSKFEGKIILSSGPNTTAQFLATNFKQKYERISLHLRKKMPKSDSLDKIDDHAMNWIERVIARNGLRKRLVENRPPAPSQMCAWARRSAYSDIRNEGREPVCRLLHGALTKQEIGQHDVSKWTTTVVPRTINEDATGDMAERLTETSSFEDEFAQSDTFELLLGRVASVLHDEIESPSDVDWHLSLMTDRFVKEMTVREIAEAHGLAYEDGRTKITKALDRVRTLVQQARAEGEFDDVFTG